MSEEILSEGINSDTTPSMPTRSSNLQVKQTALRTEEILKKRAYKYTVKLINGVDYVFSITLEKAENGNQIINLSLKEIKAGKKDITYKFKVGIDAGWKIVNRIYAGNGSDSIPTLVGLRIRYITKEDKNGGGPRFANRGGESIKSFDYFRRYLIDIDNDRIMNEIKRALLSISAS